MWKTSVQQEAKELAYKMNKLSKFLTSVQSAKISIEQLTLLDFQLKIMQQYHDVLVLRLKTAELEESCEECYTDASSIFC